MPNTVRQMKQMAGALLAATATLWGCSDSPTEGNVQHASVHASVNNSTGSAVMFDQHNASLQVGYGVLIEAHVTDASGKPISGARPTWRSTNTTVATVTTLPDSGFTTDGARASVGARAAGTAMIIATYNDVADTVKFTVEAGSGLPSNPPPQRPTVFDLTVRAVGFTGGLDSLKWTFTPVPGSVVNFVQLPAIPGDTIPTTVPQVTVPTIRGTATADANGLVTFHNMPATRFRVEVKTPDASVWASSSVDYYTPWLATMRIDVLLQKK